MHNPDNLPAIITTAERRAVETNTTLPNIDNLTILQSAFVRAYVVAGDGNAAGAARAAGYATKSAAIIGWRLLRNPEINRAILSETALALGGIAPIALRVMGKLLGAKSEFVRQNAAADILDRVGMGAKDRGRITAGGITIQIDLGD